MSGQRRALMRLTAHPHDDSILVLKFPPDLNRAIGTFQPAQQAFDLGGYVMAREHLGSLQHWARFNGVQLLNEARGTGEPTRPVQCANVVNTWVVGGREIRDYCSAPYPASRIPKFCGACGQPANPVIVGSNEPDVGAKCPGCAQVVNGGPRFCPHCGGSMPARSLGAPAIARVKGEPRPLAEAVAELDLAPREAVHTTHGDAARVALHAEEEAL